MKFLSPVILVAALGGCAAPYQGPAPGKPAATLHVLGNNLALPHTTDGVSVQLVNPVTCEIEQHFKKLGIGENQDIRVPAGEPLALALGFAGIKESKPLAQFFVCMDAILWTPDVDGTYTLSLTLAPLRSGTCHAEIADNTGGHMPMSRNQVKHVCTKQVSPGPAGTGM